MPGLPTEIHRSARFRTKSVTECPAAESKTGACNRLTRKTGLLSRIGGPTLPVPNRTGAHEVSSGRG